MPPRTTPKLKAGTFLCAPAVRQALTNQFQSLTCPAQPMLAYQSFGERQSADRIPAMIQATIPDTCEVLQTAADQLFDVAAHLSACGRHADANNVLRAAMDLAVRAMFLRSGKKSAVLSFDKILNVMRSSMSLDKGTFKDASKLMRNQILTESATRRLVSRFAKSTSANLGEVGPPRQRSEGKRVYRGVTQPKPHCRSAVRVDRPYQEKTTV